MKVAPYGSWTSPITSDLIVAGSVRLGDLAVDGEDIYWVESRPVEAGRYVVVRRAADGTISDVTPAPYNVRTRVHEYGGGAFCVAAGTLFFSHDADGRVYRLDNGGEARPLTPERALRFADLRLDEHRGRLIAVCEDHTGGGHEPVNNIVAVAADGTDTDRGGVVLVSGHDFFSNARISPDGRYLAWLAWDHPNMPWDATELWLGEFAPDGSVSPDRTLVAGGEGESIFQPQWSPDGVLHFVSDRTGWWNLYRWNEGVIEPLAPIEAEFGEPQWVFGQSTYGFASPSLIICTYSQHGTSKIAAIDMESKALTTLPTPWTEVGGIQVGQGSVAYRAGSPLKPMAVVRHDLATGETESLRWSAEAAVNLDRHGFSIPGAIEFPTSHGRTAHGFYYAPKNVGFAAPDGELPPLVVLSHGGPTGQTSTALSLQTQYWTSRGFAVLDINYGGSTGYGRPYRERLLGEWGVVDVDDCVNGARYLASEGLVDGNRLTIRGWSASGYTTLAALTFREVFKAGASHYGISDLEAMAKETHKFESRYLDRLIAPYPAGRDTYLERSPIHFVDRLSCPLILFQGLEDKVVPPNQAQMMYDAVAAKGLPVALVMFEGEQHGFRRAANMQRALDGELYFLSRVFNFTIPAGIEPVDIANL